MNFAASIISLSVLIVLVISITNHVFADDVVVVDLIGQGLIQGSKTKTAWTNQTILQFLGVPYAQSPSGELRFKAPIERDPWRHIHDATKYGQRCPVITSLTGNELDRDLEDCLNLCVYTKDLTTKRPVMLYVYGGGFYNGSSADHPPKYLLEKDIVLVVPQYRVGALGWLSTNTEDMPGNSPVLDVMFALQWVQKHIEQFGGDREQVTVFGQSAGAAVTGLLMLSPRTPSGLFKRTIIQSGSILATWACNNDPLQQTKKICNTLNCDDCIDSKNIYNCLRRINVTDILQATTDESFSPSIDDFHGVLPFSPADILTSYSGTYEIMTGVTKHDGSFILATFYDKVKSAVGNMSLIPPREFASKLFDIAKEPNASGLSKNLLTALLYNGTELDGSDHKKLIPSYIDQSSAVSMKSPLFTFATQMARMQRTTYLYTFDYEGEWTRFGYEFGNEHYPFNGGAHHSNDNIYVFSTHNLNDKDTKISKKIIDIWTSFAINGVPATENAPVILPLQNDAGPYFHIDETISIGNDFFKELQAAVNDPNKENLIRPDVEF